MQPDPSLLYGDCSISVFILYIIDGKENIAFGFRFVTQNVEMFTGSQLSIEAA
jgi:hypothetical protein